MNGSLVTNVVTVLVTGATAAISDSARAVLANLASVVREKLRRKLTDEGVLEVAIRNPSDAAAVDRLIELLDRHMREDPAFAKRLHTLWSEISAAESHDRDDVSNTISGPVHGSVVQARDVSGGISFHQPAPPPQSSAPS